MTTSPSRRLAVFLFTIAATLVGLLSFESSAQEPGDRIVVAVTLDTKVKKEVVGQVFEGSVYIIRSVNGQWCSLDQVPGWLPLKNVMTLESAIEHFSKRITHDEQDGIALAHRGMIFYEIENYELAYSDLHRSLLLDNRNPVTWMLRGMILKEQGKYADAAHDLKIAINVNPKLANAHFNLGLVFYAMHDFKQSVTAYDNAIQLAPKRALWWVSRGSAKLGAGDNQGARKDYEQAAAMDKRLADAHIGLANLALIDNRLDVALKEADLALTRQPKNGIALNVRGWILFKQKKTDEAIEDLTQAIRFAPQLSLAYGNRGVCFVEKKEFEKAIADHTKHLELTPDSPFAFSNRAVAWMGAGRFDNAKSDFESAEKIAPKLDAALNAYAWFLATCPDEKFRNGKLAVEKATLACELTENDDWNHLDTLAASYAETGDFDAAVQWANKALAAAPDNKKNRCQEQINRFQQKQPFRSPIGKHAEK